jgi:hypothetical protein
VLIADLFGRPFEMNEGPAAMIDAIARFSGVLLCSAEC